MFKRKFTSANIMGFITKAIADLQAEENSLDKEYAKLQEEENKIKDKKEANTNHRHKIIGMIKKIEGIFGVEESK